LGATSNGGAGRHFRHGFGEAQARMGLYTDWVLPRLLDLAMRNHGLDQYRRKTIEQARGVVLEVGVGSGLNLRLYERDVDRVYALDPSLELLALACEGIRDAVVPVSLVRASAEAIPFPSSAFDTIIMTWTLC
jgi:ubiquinone/menaquinone biosynthesis C-methylase UbiE